MVIKQILTVSTTLLLTVLPEIIVAQVKISEFLANNVAVNPDNWDFEDFSDWIELHNEGTSAADIGGYYLTGDLKQNKKWQIPSGTSITLSSPLYPPSARTMVAPRPMTFCT